MKLQPKYYGLVCAVHQITTALVVYNFGASFTHDITNSIVVRILATGFMLLAALLPLTLFIELLHERKDLVKQFTLCSVVGMLAPFLFLTTEFASIYWIYFHIALYLMFIGHAMQSKPEVTENSTNKAVAKTAGITLTALMGINMFK